MYNLGSLPVGYSDTPVSQSYPTLSRNKWQIEWLYKDGGLKRELDFNLESYINAFEFELNEKICGAASVNLVYIDFPINIDDIVTLKYNGSPFYKGFIETIPDKKGGKVKIEPFHKLFDSMLYTGSFVAKTISEILETIILAKYSTTGIRWVSLFVDITDSTTFSFNYSNEKVKKIIDDLVKKLDDTYWGVNANNIFVVYQDEASVSRILDNCENQEYISVNSDIDYSKIKATRYQVYQKVADGDSQLLGEVGYGGSYPILALEQVVHSKEDKYNITVEGFSSSEALDFAYSALTAQSAPVSTQIKGFNLENWTPEIGKKIKTFDKLELVNKRVLNCNSLTDDCTFNFFDDGTSAWGKTNGTLTADTNEYIYDGFSIKYASSSGFNCIFGYDFVNDVRLLHPISINFQLMASRICTFSMGVGYQDYYLIDDEGNYIIDDEGDYIVSQETVIYPINIENPNRWILFEFDIKDFSYLKNIDFYIGNQLGLNIWIDNFNIFGYFREEITGNIKKIKVKINRENTNLIDFNLDFYDKQLNDAFFDYQKRVDTLERISQESS